MAEWSTELSSVKQNEILVRGYPVEQLMEKASYTDAVYLLFKGELPSAAESALFAALLTSCVDHGVTPPSIHAAMNAASTGAPLNAAVASGILSINRFHGGAVEDAMELFAEAVTETGPSADRVKIARFVEEGLAKGRRFPGYGHLNHTTDPRTVKLGELARRHLTPAQRIYADAAFLIEEEMARLKGKKLPLNVDGMIGALLLGLAFPPELANGIFMISRVPGLIAHYVEERRTQKPMRAIDPHAAQYAGRPKRNIDRP